MPEHERDPDLKAHLKTEPRARSALLAWAVEGCRAWQREGLNVPDRVRSYTAEYRRENDPVAEWLEACCVLDPSATASAGDLRRSYEGWAEQNGEKPISAKALGTALRGRGCETKATKRERLWRGVRLEGVTD